MGTRLYAQTDERNINPVIDYSRTPQQYTIGNITVDGVKSYDDYILIGLSGLSKGQKIMLPGEEITNAIKRYWRNGLFSNVAIRVDSIIADSAYLHITLDIGKRHDGHVLAELCLWVYVCFVGNHFILEVKGVKRSYRGLQPLRS